MTDEMLSYRIGQLQREITTTYDKYRKQQSELADLLKSQQECSESNTKGKLLQE